ncbi:META domain-containing protein [Candidatus Methylopumilus turicensis]|uniref:DUF306 domain-containing protein n=1 Tax=Candidatus Methylopumilus turicensis TaxID=1581680 RepID=A0A0B7IYX5_9PROT|nr:META domain-containing protein [Candidatus Methylopumilus turicensis]CEN56299.1 protein of unknown function [Candidatus Methylopumilus turicensis]
MPKKIIVQEVAAEDITLKVNHDKELKAKLAQIAQAEPSKTAVVKELKPTTATERTSLSELYNQNWQMSRILISNNFIAHENHWQFGFNKNGKYKAFGACNYLTGKFNASDDGAFRLGKLETSLNDCPESKDEEVMVFNMLLMADSFAIQGERLVLKSGGRVMMELRVYDQEINVQMAKRSHSKKDKKSLKDRKTSKAKSPKAKASKKKTKKSQSSQKKT